MFGFGKKKKQEEGLNSLFEAIMQNDAQKVKDLLWGKILYGHKIDPNARAVLNNVKTTPLCLAAGRGFEDIVGILLEHGAQVNFATAEGMTPLHFAVFKPMSGVSTFFFSALDCKR